MHESSLFESIVYFYLSLKENNVITSTLKLARRNMRSFIGDVIAPTTQPHGRILKPTQHEPREVIYPQGIVGNTQNNLSLHDELCFHNNCEYE